MKRHAGRLDRVLVSESCSGTGTWRRKLDARWRTEGAGLETLPPQQGRILANAARLVYVTCSMLPGRTRRKWKGTSRRI